MGRIKGRQGGRLQTRLQCRLQRALCLVKGEKLSEAVAVCSGAIKRSPQCGSAFYRRGQALFLLGQNDAAKWDLERAEALMPGNALVKKMLVRTAQATTQASRRRLPRC